MGGCHGDPSPLRTVHFASQSHASVNIALHYFGFCPIEILTTDHTSCSLGSIPEGRRMSKSETHIVFLHYNLLENDMGQSLFQRGFGFDVASSSMSLLALLCKSRFLHSGNLGLHTPVTSREKEWNEKFQTTTYHFSLTRVFKS